MEINSIGKPSDFWESVRNLRKSATDKKIAGVCGGFGEHTPMPSWLWRALFLLSVFLWGGGPCRLHHFLDLYASRGRSGKDYQQSGANLKQFSRNNG
jgi:phage shock protein PspC (stress-responsive transcriptional regulator)